MSLFSKIVTIAAGAGTIIGTIKLLILPVLSFIRKSNENDEKLASAIDNLSQKVDNNERDRLRAEIFSYGNKARRKMPISFEEFRHLQESFAKYENLGGNGIAREEYEFIRDYFNN